MARKIMPWALAVLIGGSLNPVRAQVAIGVEWQRCIGGSGAEYEGTLQPASDGGFICIGYTMSADGDAAGSHGDADILVTKLNANGTVQWRRVLGGSGADMAFYCMEASDGSIMVLAQSDSNDGDVTGNHGSYDCWVVKLSPLGNIIWQHAYGGSGSEGAHRMQETADGGFVITAMTSSNDGDVVGYHGGGDGWVFKIDPAGNVEWSRALGGSGLDNVSELIQTVDGGFLLWSGYTESNDGDVSNYHGSWDCWLVKLNVAGGLEWSRTVGGSGQELCTAVLELGNGDIMLLGNTKSEDGDIQVNRGDFDVFLAKVSASGQLLWTRTYGGSQDDECHSLLATPDGGFLISGWSSSNDGDLSGNHGGDDAWVFKVDANGALVWQRLFGGSASELMFFLHGSGQGGYVISGFTGSHDGDVQGGHGALDFWLAEFDANGELRWQRCVGGSAEDIGFLYARTPDGGYIVLTCAISMTTPAQPEFSL